VSGTLRLLSYNIKYGGTGREDAVAAVVRSARADIVMLQEATDPGVVARVAASSEMLYWGSERGHSTAYISRLPIRSHQWLLPRAARHPFLEVVVDGGAGGGERCRIFGLHLTAWFSRWSENTRAREIQALLQGIREHQAGFHLIAGDFNALAPGERLEVGRMPRWIRAMIWVSGRDIARHTIQTMLDADYVDAFKEQQPAAAGYTFPTWDPHVRLDYVFLSRRDRSRIKRCEVLVDAPRAAEASDHFGLLVELDG
jgi:endonuclease/exonuclease/phosphatase family metal-dependent hydrolase